MVIGAFQGAGTALLVVEVEIVARQMGRPHLYLTTRTPEGRWVLVALVLAHLVAAGMLLLETYG